MKRYETPRSNCIKAYYDDLRLSVGLTSKQIAKKIGVTTVTMSNMTHRLDHFSAEKLEIMAKLFGVEPGDFVSRILDLRKDCADELDA